MLEAIRFVNCQSFEDTTIEFSTDKCNVLIAQNNTGKSILFKMLKVTANPNYFPAKKRNMLIRRGATSASMICAFTDGCVGITTITTKGVIYRWRNAGEEVFTSYAEPPQIYLDELGLIVDQRSKFIANIVDTDQDMLLVNSDQKGNHELLRLLAEDQTLIEVKEKLIREISYFKKYNSELLAKQVDMQNNLASLEVADVESLRYEYDTGQALYSTLGQLLDIGELLDIISSYCEVSFNYSLGVDVIDTILSLQQIQDSLATVTTEAVIDKNLIDSVNFVADIYNNLEAIQVVPDSLMDIEVLDDLIRLTECFEEIQIVKEDNSVELIDVLLSGNKIIANLNSLWHFQRERHALDFALYQLTTELESMNCIVACPIHGEVIYDGKECLPYNI